MFSGIWAKITAGLAFLSGILFIWAKSERAAKQKAQHENKIHDKINTIEESQKKAEEEALEAEPEKIEERIEKEKKLSRRERASKL